MTHQYPLGRIESACEDIHLDRQTSEADLLRDGKEEDELYWAR